MKTQILITIETPDDFEVVQLDEEENIKITTDDQEKAFRKDYCTKLHKEMVDMFKKYTGMDYLKDYLMDEIQEAYIEDFASFENYQTKITQEVVQDGMPNKPIYLVKK